MYARCTPLTLPGSSPRLWGTHDHGFVGIFIQRFIPTPVGNTSCLTSGHSISAVHPHACGEHSCCISSRCAINGSSPRLWGTLYSIGCKKLDPRFIPTPVGNTRIRLRIFPAPPVHPHACGEHRRLPVFWRFFHGSSPRLWGTHHRPSGLLNLVRFIPTPVGNTAGRRNWQENHPVHPHACGEHAQL